MKNLNEEDKLAVDSTVPVNKDYTSFNGLDVTQLFEKDYQCEGGVSFFYRNVVSKGTLFIKIFCYLARKIHISVSYHTFLHYRIEYHKYGVTCHTYGTQFDKCIKVWG